MNERRAEVVQAVEAIWSMSVTEYFFLDRVVISRDGLRSRGILPVRAIPLGYFPTAGAAWVFAQGRRSWDAEAVIAENVRTAVERKLGLVYGLSHGQIDRLQRGERLVVDDGIGRMELAYQPGLSISEEFEK